MKFLCGVHILVLCAVLIAVSSAPVEEPEAKLTKRHDLSSDKELLLKKLKDLENELQGRRSSEVLEENDPVTDPRKKEEVEGASVRDENVLSSMLRSGTNQEAVPDPEDPYKEILKRLLDEEFESGEFVDQPFTDDKLGQKPAVMELDNNDMQAMLDSISIDDLKQLLSTLKQNKQAFDEDNGDDDDGDGGDGGDGGDDDESSGFLQDITVDDLKNLIKEIKKKKQDGETLTQEDMGKVVEYFVSHLSTGDLQSMLAALRERDRETEEETEEDDETLDDALEDLVSRISTDDLRRLLAAVRARKQELSSEESEEVDNTENAAVNDRDIVPRLTEEEVMLALMDFISGLSTEDLKKTILAVRRKKLEMKLAAEKTAAEYMEGDYSEDDEDDGDEDDDDDDDDEIGDESGPCAQEKQDILDIIEAARLTGNRNVGGEMPNCNEDGYYAPKQCSGSMCYCVDVHGTAIEGEAMIWEAASLKCSQEDAEITDDNSPADDASTEGSEDVDEEEVEDAKLEQVERDLLEMLKQQKRHQLAKNDGLNM